MDLSAEEYRTYSVVEVVEEDGYDLVVEVESSL